MPSRVEQPLETVAGEPWGVRLWVGLAAVLVITGCLCSYGISTWPMADDEVPSLVEMGLFRVDAAAFSVPAAQIGRLPRAMPVWYGVQRMALSVLPANELGFRIPSLVCAILTAGLVFVLAARWRGMWYATALAIVVTGSQLFVLLAQIDRFYSMPLLLLTLTLAAIWVPQGGLGMLLAAGLLAALTVLSHNITVAVFALAFLACCAAYVVGRVPLRVVTRSGVAAAAGVLLYTLYLRPLIQGWASTGNPTPVLVSFAAYAGVAVLALAFLGMWVSVTRHDEGPSMLWWAIMFAGTIAFLQVAPVSWNPRYFVFFMPAMWVLAAHAMALVARRIGHGWTGAAWYACVAVLLLPALLSHYQDGSRHNYRQAASVLVQHATPGQPILSDDAETISYYLPASLRQSLQVRTKVREVPSAEFFLVTRSNAWAALPRYPGRETSVVAEIYRRRFDQFSHILRVYRVAAAHGQ